MLCRTNRKTATKVSLKVNGKRMELNLFVKDFIAGTVIGMVGSLRGANNIKTVSLEITRGR